MSERPTTDDQPDPGVEPREELDHLARLRTLAELHRDGVLTDEEFEAQKRLLLQEPARRRRLRRPRRRRVVVAGLLVLLGGVGGGIALQRAHDRDVRERRETREREERATAAREARERSAREAERRAREEQEQTEKLEIAVRRDLILDLRKSVTADFRKRVSEGVLDGPILGTTCDPVSGGADELGESTGTFNCLVATERTSADGRRGYPVDATVNYTRFSYTWQLSS